MSLYPWQCWLLVHALELADDLTVETMHERDPLNPVFRFRKVVVLVARQSGKSTVSQVLSLFFLYVLGVDLILGTAQDLDTAEEVWEGALDIIEETPELAELADKPIKVNGKKTIRLKSGERYKVKAANRRAGRGLSGDLILLDELREHTSFDAWAAITKTTQARPAAMIWALSNAGDVSSVVLATLRAMAHLALGDPDGINAAEQAAQTPDEHDIAGFEDLSDEDGAKVVELSPEDFEEDPDTLGLFEWSATPDCDVMDRDGWAQANPAMNYGISEATIAGDAATEGRNPALEWTFRTEVLCQWRSGGMHGPFPSGKWEAGQNEPEMDENGMPQVAEADRIVGRFAVAIDMSRDRSRTYIARCGRRADGVDQAELWAARPGSDWVADWLRDHRADITMVCGQDRGAPVSGLLGDLQGDKTLGLRFVPLDLLASFGAAHDAVRDGDVRHNVQPALDGPAGSAVTKSLAGGAMVIDRFKSPGDASPLIAWCNAVWLWRRPAKHSKYAPAPRILGAPEATSTTGRPRSRATTIMTTGF